MPDIIYYLSTCDTCRKILKETATDRHAFTYQDIRTEPLNEKQVDEMAARTGSYESMVNKRAILYKERGLAKQQLTDTDFRKLLLEHYTFLKRPVVILGDQLFAGNDKKTVAALAAALGNSAGSEGTGRLPLL